MNLTQILITVLISQILTLESVQAVGFENPGRPPISDREENNDGEFERGRGRRRGNENSERLRDVKLGRTRNAGDGCPAGTVSAVISPDATELTLLFDNFVVQAGNSVGVQRAAKRCTVTVPIEAPEGYRVSVTRFDYRGVNLLPEMAMTSLQTSYTYVDAETGRRYGHRFSRRMMFRGPLDEEYTINAELYSGKVLWSRCGKKFDLEILTGITTRTNHRGEDAMTSLDSIDMASETVQYYLNWEKCEEGRGDIRNRRNQRPN